MARCPNCGRETARTKDWSCRWCGYPLFSRSHKKIDKTYRELKEERLSQQPVIEEAGHEEAPEEAELEAVVEPEPERVSYAKAKPERVSHAKPEPVLEEEAEVEIESEAEEEPIPEFEIDEELVPEPEPEIEPISEKKPEVEIEPVVEEEPIPETELEIEEETEVEIEPEVEEEPVVEEERITEPEPEPVALEMTVDELLSTYETEGVDADKRFARQILRITGTVDRIEVKATLNIYYITLVRAEKFRVLQNVRCVFDGKHESELSQLIAGQTVTVQGRYDGSIIDISLRDCFLVH